MNVSWHFRTCRGWRRALALRATGVLPEAERPGLEAHLAECRSCRCRDAELSRLATGLRVLSRSASEVEPSAALRVRWKRAVRAEPQTESLSRTEAMVLAFTRTLVQRPAWAGFAAVWLAIGFFQVTSPAVAELPDAASMPAPRQLYLALRDPDWQRLKLAGELASPPAEAPNPSPSRPRSERQSGTNSA